MKTKIALILIRLIAVISANAFVLFSSAVLAKWFGFAPSSTPTEWVLVTYIAANVASIAAFHIFRDRSQVA